jgi:hypothetical protein
MRAIFLGTADGHTSARREHSGILLQTRGGDSSLLLDCGAAAARFFLHKKIETDIPEILWISHMHSDHNGQVSSLIQSLWLRARRAPLHVFGPAGVLAPIKDWLEKCLLFPELIGFPIHWHPVKPGKPFVHGPFTMTAFATQHLVSLASHFKRAYPKTCFDCYGLVITHVPERDLFHEVAKYAVQSVWITHYPDHLVRKEAEIKAMAKDEKFRGDVHLMHDRVAHEI